jgi:hypothetical protein
LGRADQRGSFETIEKVVGELDPSRFSDIKRSDNSKFEENEMKKPNVVSGHSTPHSAPKPIPKSVPKSSANPVTSTVQNQIMRVAPGSPSTGWTVEKIMKFFMSPQNLKKRLKHSVPTTKRLLLCP